MIEKQYWQLSHPLVLLESVDRWGKPCPRCSSKRKDRLCNFCDGLSHCRRPSERKQRLIACATWRYLLDELAGSGRSLEDIERTERFIEGYPLAEYAHSVVRETAKQVVQLALQHSKRVRREGTSRTLHAQLEPALQVVTDAARSETTHAVRPSVKAISRHYRKAGHKLTTVLIRQDQRRLCALIRDILGNPFQPSVIETTWLDANRKLVRTLAEDIDATGQFEDLPVLADALEEGGCQDKIILSHARQPRHYRGCWLIDLILNKA